MSTTICQNTQSCFDTVTLKLNPPNSTMKSPSLDSNKTGWSYTETLSNTSEFRKEMSGELDVYVHPLVKRSMYTLSDRSLKMCTENLGSETGSDTAEDDIFFMMSSSPSSSSPSPSASPLSSSSSSSPFSFEGKYIVKSSKKLHYKKDESKKAGYESLPPPLTTMSGTNAIRVQPHRENGRLVMTTVTTSPRKSPILYERRNGRLTMSLLEDSFNDGELEDEDEEEEVNGEIKYSIDALEQEGLEEYEKDQKENQSLEEDIHENEKEVGDKFAIVEFQRLSRCKEGGRGNRRLINLETYWVAT